MADQHCRLCGSKYVTFKGKEENIERVVESYYCQSCKKNFTVTTNKNSGSRTWLMTISGDKMFSEYRRKLEIYKTPNGITFGQTVDGKYLTRNFTPKAKRQYNEYTHTYYLWFDTFTYFNDSDGTYVTPEKIELNPELTEKAMQNEAMRIIHVKGNEFSCGKGYNETTLVDDLASWFNSALHVPGAGGSSSSSSGGCYVATAVYGSYDCPQVWTLRRFRDQKLAATWYGRAFIRVYYAVSPTLVKWFGNTGWFRRFWRGKLDKMVKDLQAQGMEDTPYEDLY